MPTGKKTSSHLLLLLLLLVSVLAASCDDFAFYDLFNNPEDTDSGIELQISPVSATMPVGAELHFYSRGGTKPYGYQVISGNGSIDADTGVYVAPDSPSVDIIRVTDAEASYVDAQVVVVE